MVLYMVCMIVFVECNATGDRFNFSTEGKKGLKRGMKKGYLM